MIEDDFEEDFRNAMLVPFDVVRAACPNGVTIVEADLHKANVHAEVRNGVLHWDINTLVRRFLSQHYDKSPDRCDTFAESLYSAMRFNAANRSGRV